MTKTHIPKKHHDFENPIQGKMFDNTNNRIYGESNQQLFGTNNTEYGTGKSKADGIARVGRKNQQMEREIERQVMQEMRERQQAIDARQEERYFDTTNRENLVAMDMTANTIGRKVMQTQDGKLVAGATRDDQFIVEQGMYRRTAKATDQELMARIPQGDYTQARPVTIYTEALERKNTYMSAATGPNPFARSSGMTQPLNQTKAVVGFAGNVDFEKEKTVVNFARTAGRDLNIRNPYMEQHVQISNFDEIKAKVIALCKKRSANGLRGLRSMFRAMDRNRNGSLSPVEFKYAMRDYGMNFSEIEVTPIVKHFDTNKDGMLSFDEFLRAIRGSLNQRRLDMVHQAYRVLDKDGSGQVTIDDVRIAYDVSFHPDFQSGRKTADEGLSDFMTVWETHKRDQIVTIEEFEDYYKDLSASIDSDDYFELMIRNA